MNANISHAMHCALELVRDGATPTEAAERAGVTLSGLYRAMRRGKVGKRCPTCGRMLPNSDGSHHGR